MNAFIENSIKKTKLLLEYFGYVLSEEEIFLLSDLYKIRFNQDEYMNTCPLETAAFRLFFFITHFISQDSAKFADELYDMKVTKNYPFPVVFRCGVQGDFAVIMGVRRNDKKIILLGKDNSMVLTDFETLKKNLDGRIEWWVIMPSQKKISVPEVTSQTAYKAVRYMLNMANRDRVDNFYKTGYLKKFIGGILKVAERKSDNKIKELLSRYEEIIEGDSETRNTDESEVLKELFEYMG